MTFLAALSFITVISATNLVPNGDFESGMQGWGSLWTRDAGVGSVSIDNDVVHTGNNSARIEHSGAQDWSFNPGVNFDVRNGDFFILDGWIKITGTGNAEICVITRDENDEVIEWSYAGQNLSGDQDWNHLTSRFFVPHNVQKIYPRIIGHGPATVWIDDFKLTKEGNISDFRSDLPDIINFKNALISVDLEVETGILKVKDSRTSQIWEQQPYHDMMVLKSAEVNEDRLDTTWFYAQTGADVNVTFAIAQSRPELLLTITGAGDLPGSLSFPNPFVTDKESYLVIPMNEGISYPVDDLTINTGRLIGYGGHGICMGFWGATDGAAGHMAILETADDAAIRITRINDLLCVAPEWDSQKGKFGYPRRIRYVFFDKGGHVAMCKRYRAHAQETGIFKTLAKKREENPNVDLLIGAVNVWCWDGALSYVNEMQQLGIERILWSHRESPNNIQQMNQRNVLTSRYDIYQDLMNPDYFQYLNGVHPDWTTDGWPDDIMLDKNGDWRRGWEVTGKDGKKYPCGVLSDCKALDYARPRISNELQTHAYRSRFIDTTTASPWREDYHPDHPMTRSESRFWKMELLRLVSEEMKLVCGSETGHDAAVPFAHYFEGMLSLGPYRVPDAGRHIQDIWDEVPERVAKFQLGHDYRLPLWELVYHDCVVAQWYWGDYNNKLPSLWDKRDLFNILYATPPMFMFNKAIWNENKDRFVQSYKNVCPIVRSVGYSEMTDHRFLTADRSIQQTEFDNGTIITVNFSDAPYTLADGVEISTMNFHVNKSDETQCNKWMQHK